MSPTDSKHTYTVIAGIYNCDDCGAHQTVRGKPAFKAEDVKHYSTCTVGESVKWQQFYTQAAEEEAADPNADEDYGKYLDEGDQNDSD